MFRGFIAAALARSRSPRKAGETGVIQAAASGEQHSLASQS